MRRIHVIGIGAGDPGYVTAQAVDALNDVDVFFASDKGAVKDDLVSLRREICERFIRDPGYRFVELPDPSGPRRPPTVRPIVGSSPTGTPPAPNCGLRRSATNWPTTASAPSWPGVIRRYTTAPCASST